MDTENKFNWSVYYFPPSPLVLFKELGEKRVGRRDESQVQLLPLAWELGRECGSCQRMCLLQSAPGKGIWLDFTYGINIINS